MFDAGTEALSHSRAKGLWAGGVTKQEQRNDGGNAVVVAGEKR